MKLKLALTVAVAATALLLTGCSNISTAEQQEVASAYTEFVKEASTLDNAQVIETTKKLSSTDWSEKPSDWVKDQMFAEYDKIEPEFFEKLGLPWVNYEQAGYAYSRILLTSLATEGQAIVTVIPPSAVTKINKDAELGIPVWEIDRDQITSAIPLGKEHLFTPEKKETTGPVRMTNVNGFWQVIPDNWVLAETGTPSKEVGGFIE